MMMGSWWLQLLVIVLLHCFVLIHGHNWINNPRSRVKGLSKELCETDPILLRFPSIFDQHCDVRVDL